MVHRYRRCLFALGNKGGESETIIGNWLKKSGKRDRIVLATRSAWRCRRRKPA
nr:hypothetical protein [Candidatus Pantoea persica]